MDLLVPATDRVRRNSFHMESRPSICIAPDGSISVTTATSDNDSDTLTSPEPEGPEMTLLTPHRRMTLLAPERRMTLSLSTEYIRQRTHRPSIAITPEGSLSVTQNQDDSDWEEGPSLNISTSNFMQMGITGPLSALAVKDSVVDPDQCVEYIGDDYPII